MTSGRIEELEKLIAAAEDEGLRLRDLVKANNEQERALKIEHAELKFGVKAGAIVMYRGAEHLVTSVSPAHGRNKPWVYGRKKVKSGEWGTRISLLSGDWSIAAATSA